MGLGALVLLQPGSELLLAVRSGARVTPVPVRAHSARRRDSELLVPERIPGSAVEPECPVRDAGGSGRRGAARAAMMVVASTFIDEIASTDAEKPCYPSLTFRRGHYAPTQPSPRPSSQYACALAARLSLLPGVGHGFGSVGVWPAAEEFHCDP